MAALLTMRNDGPDAVEIRMGRTSRVLHAGQELHVATSVPVDVCAVANLSAQDMAMHMGMPMAQSDPCRHVDGS